MADLRALLDSTPDVDWLHGDRGYDANWFREALKDKRIRACIPGRKQRKKPVNYCKRRYKRRNRIEIMFGRLKDWRRVATRYDRCPKVFLSATALAALVIYWLSVLTLSWWATSSGVNHYLFSSITCPSDCRLLLTGAAMITNFSTDTEGDQR